MHVLFFCSSVLHTRTSATAFCGRLTRCFMVCASLCCREQASKASANVPLRTHDVLSFHMFFLLFCRFQVAGVSAGQYVRLFEWDYSKFAVRQRLPALVALIQGGVGKIEEEHRNLSMVFSEKNQALQVRGASAFPPPLPSRPSLTLSLFSLPSSLH